MTDLKPFNRAESGAAWVAQALSDRLIIAPHEGESVQVYFGHVLSDVRERAAKETKLPLDTLPGQTLSVQPGDTVCLISDGLYRLVSPYATHTPEAFMALVAEGGLSAAVSELRTFEAVPNRDMPRLKVRDDASGVFLRIDA